MYGRLSRKEVFRPWLSRAVPKSGERTYFVNNTQILFAKPVRNSRWDRHPVNKAHKVGLDQAYAQYDGISSLS